MFGYWLGGSAMSGSYLRVRNGSWRQTYARYDQGGSYYRCRAINICIRSRRLGSNPTGASCHLRLAVKRRVIEIAPANICAAMQNYICGELSRPMPTRYVLETVFNANAHSTGEMVFQPFWTRKRIPKSYESCSCWGCRCCYQIFEVLRLFHFTTDCH